MLQVADRGPLGLLKGYWVRAMANACVHQCHLWPQLCISLPTTLRTLPPCAPTQATNAVWIPWSIVHIAAYEQLKAWAAPYVLERNRCAAQVQPLAIA